VHVELSGFKSTTVFNENVLLQQLAKASFLQGQPMFIINNLIATE
jgi:hypothetical protein